MPSPAKSPFNISIFQKIFLGFGLAVLLLSVIAFVTWSSTRSFLENAGLVAHSQQVFAAEELLLRHLKQAESAERGYIITGDSSYLLHSTSAWVLIDQDFLNLKQLTADNASQQGKLSMLEPLIKRKLAVVKYNIAARQIGGSEHASGEFAKGEDRLVMSDIEEIMTAFEKDEQKLLTERLGFFNHLGEATTGIIIVGTLASVLFIAFAMGLILRDIAARRNAEQELANERNLLSTLIETIPYHVYVKDTEGRYLLDNASHRAHLGVKESGDIKGKSPYDFFPQELASVQEEEDRRVMETGVPLLNHEEPSVDREGNLVWYSTSKAPIHDSTGKMVGIVCLSANVTESKHASEKLQHFAGQLEKSNEQLRDFASIASHDLQEPLRKILAFGDRLRMKCGDELGGQGKDYLSRMQDAAERMRTLINDILTLSRVANTTKPFVEVNLSEIAAGVISDLEMLIEHTGASVEVGYLPRIEADAAQMRQIFQNLLSNALKFHEPGRKPIVSISAKILEVNDYQVPGALPGSDVCQIMVQDNGIGFGEEYSEKIFSIFQRLHSRAEYKGPGLAWPFAAKLLIAMEAGLWQRVLMEAALLLS